MSTLSSFLVYLCIVIPLTDAKCKLPSKPSVRFSQSSEYADKLGPQYLQMDCHKNKVIRFAAIGDWGVNIENEMKKGRDRSIYKALEAIAESIQSEALSLDFVVSLGDNFYECGLNDVHSKRFLTDWYKRYNIEHVKLPWFIIMGNHDNLKCYNTENAPIPGVQVEFTYIEKQNPKSKYWYLPSSYYGLKINTGLSHDISMLFLNTSDLVAGTKYSGKQLEWLENMIPDSSDKTRDIHYVVGHHSPFSGVKGKDKASGTLEEDNANIRSLANLLNEKNVEAFFGAHHHSLQHVTHNNVNYFISGGGGHHKLHKRDRTVGHMDRHDGVLQYFSPTHGYVIHEIDVEKKMTRSIFKLFNLNGEELEPKVVELPLKNLGKSHKTHASTSSIRAF